MEKKEKKSDLEGLLNSLIEKGWKPRGKNAYNCCDNAKRIWYEGGEESYRDYIEITPRKLTSKESGLWQFCCENGMVGKTSKRWEQFNSDTGKFYGFYDDNSTYRLIESALCDEDKLEEFLLNSIKLD